MVLWIGYALYILHLNILNFNSFDGHMDMDKWTWTHMDMDTWTWTPRHRCMDITKWTWTHRKKMGMSTCKWTWTQTHEHEHGHKHGHMETHLDVDTWTWTIGLKYMDMDTWIALPFPPQFTVVVQFTLCFNILYINFRT
jgi:hypothetical protein